VAQEPPVSENDCHIRIQPQHEHSIQQIVPTVAQGRWIFISTALSGFKGCDVEFRYHLWKAQAGNPRKEISSGQLVKGARLDLQPEVPGPPQPTHWEIAEAWIKRFGGFVGWTLAGILALIQIKKYRDERPKPPLTPLEP
jgi:hypothetical protein